MKKTLIVVVVILGVMAVIFGWNHLPPEATLEVARPELTTIRAYVEEQAVTELPNDYLISMPIDGWLEQIDLR